MKNKKIVSTVAALFAVFVIFITPCTASASNNSYTIGKDNWYFRNMASSFGNGYTFTDEDTTMLCESLSNIELRQASGLIDNSFAGSCYGMAATSILASYDLIDYSDFSESANSLYTLANIESQDDKPSDEILSFINYYTALQFTEEVRQYAIHSMVNETEKDKLNKIIENAEQGIPSLIAYMREFDENGNRVGHAVVAYDVEYGKFKAENKTYDGRISVYNCNLYEGEESYIYFTNDGSWYTDGCHSENGAMIGVVISDINLINNKGLLKGTTSYTNNEDFIALLTSNALNANVDKIIFDNGNWRKTDSANTAAVDYPVFLGDTDNYAKTYALKDGNSGCALSTVSPKEYSLEMNYRNSLLNVYDGAAKQAVFDPSGYIEVSGENARYELEMVFNEGHHNGSWRFIQIIGTAKNASLMKTDKGYILKSDNLPYGTQIITNNQTENFYYYFKADDTDSVLIFEKDDGGVGIAVDKDNDGEYETVTDYMNKPTGDVNNDGVLSMADHVTLKKWLVAYPDTIIAAPEMADMNSDGKVNVFDFILQRRALLAKKNSEPLYFNEKTADIHTALGIECDMSYENITAKSVQEIYPNDTDKIQCDITNHNKGKGFYFYQLPYLEKYVDGEWKRLYNGTNVQMFADWQFCGIEDAPDMEFSTRVTILTKDLNSFTKGHYRFVIYTAKNILYDEFDVED